LLKGSPIAPAWPGLEVEFSGAGHRRPVARDLWEQEDVSGISLLLTEACQDQDTYRKGRE
jgi:hypothetical protein